jgi:hypothetical protein
VSYLIGVHVGGKPSHWPPRYERGLPANCSAYIQISIDGIRNGEYTTKEALAGMERNCGSIGKLWDEEQ